MVVLYIDTSRQPLGVMGRAKRRIRYEGPHDGKLRNLEGDLEDGRGASILADHP